MCAVLRLHSWGWPSLSWGSQSVGPQYPARPPPPRCVNKPAGICLSGLFSPPGSAAVWRGLGGRVSAPGVERAGRCLIRLTSEPGVGEPNVVCLRAFGGLREWLCGCVRAGLVLCVCASLAGPSPRLRIAGSHRPGAPGQLQPSLPGSQAVSSSYFTARPATAPVITRGPDAAASLALTPPGRSLELGRAQPALHCTTTCAQAAGGPIRCAYNKYRAPTACNPAAGSGPGFAHGQRHPPLLRAPAPGDVPSQAFVRGAARSSRPGRSPPDDWSQGGTSRAFCSPRRTRGPGESTASQFGHSTESKLQEDMGFCFVHYLIASSWYSI